MIYRQFVEYVKKESAATVEHLVFDLGKHLILLNGEGDKGMVVQVENVAISNPMIRKTTWQLKILPLILKCQAQRIALVVVGPMQLGEESEVEAESGQLAVLATIADAERTERWLGVVQQDDEMNLSVEWQEPVLDASIPDFWILEEALR